MPKAKRKTGSLNDMVEAKRSRESRGPSSEPSRGPSSEPTKLSDSEIASISQQVVKHLQPLLVQQPQVVGTSLDVQQSLQNAPQQVAPSTSSDNTDTGDIPLLCIPSVQDDLGSFVPNSLKIKIINGEFVDLSLMLAPQRQDVNQTRLEVRNGQIVISEPRRQGKKITTIESWTDAFLVYANILGGAFPDQFPHLLKYMYIIRLGASRVSSLSWIE